MPVSTIENLAGRKIGQIQLGSITSSTPRKYAVRCDKCGGNWNELHETITTRLNSGLLPECRNSACRKGTIKIETNAREWHIEDARRERAKAQKEADGIAAKKLKQTEQEFKDNAKKLALIERERAKTDRDDGFKISDTARSLPRMSQSDADRYNAVESARFAENTPEYYPCDANHETLCNYLVRNGIQIADEAQWRLAFERLDSLGLMEPWPEPEPIHDEPDPLPSSHEGYYQPAPRLQQRYDGYDENGEPCSYNEYQVRNMSSE